MISDEDLAKAESALKSKIRGAERRIEETQTQLRRLRRELAAIQVLRGVDAAPRTGGARPTSQRVQDVAYEVLSARGAPMHFRELYAELLARGVPLGGRDPAAGLITYLVRDKERFEWASRGTYRAKPARDAGREDRAEGR